MQKNSGQGALEYLLLIGGAVLISAIVIAILTSLGTSSKNTVAESQATVGGAFQQLEQIANSESSAPLPTDPTLILFYNFDGGSTGTHSPTGINCNVSGAVGKGCELDGTGFISAGNALDAVSNEITAMFWMKTTTANEPNQAGTPIGYSTSPTSNDNEFIVYNYQALSIYRTYDHFDTGIPANDGQWHHIAATWRSSDGQTKLFKDGIEVSSGTLRAGSLFNHTPSSSLIIGQEQDRAYPNEGGLFDATQSFKGTIDEIKIYNRALSPSEILDNCNASKPAGFTCG